MLASSIAAHGHHGKTSISGHRERKKNHQKSLSSGLKKRLTFRSPSPKKSKKYITARLSAAQVEMCRDVFEEIDEDGSGKIDMDEMSKAMQMLTGTYPSRRLVRTMFKAVDDDDSGEIDFNEFKQLWGMQIDFKRKAEKAKHVSPPLLPQECSNRFVQLFYIFDDPSKSLVGHYVSLFIMLIIVISVTCFVLESMPELRYWTGGSPGRGEFVGLPFFGVIEVVSIIVFTIEYLVRFLLVGFIPSVHDDDERNFCQKVSNFTFGIMNMIDFVAIVPFYIELFVPKGSGAGDHGLGALRILRVARVFRIFKLGKYSNGMQLFASVMAKSMPALILLSFFLIIAVVLFGALIYFAEQGTWDADLGGFARPDVTGHDLELTPFLTVPIAFWWVVVTSTTVGYGDMYPTTITGKWIAVLCMMMGVLALALPVSVIGANFADIYGKKMREQIQGEQKSLMAMWKSAITEETEDEHISQLKATAEKRIGDADVSGEMLESAEEQLQTIMNQLTDLSAKAAALSKEICNKSMMAHKSQDINSVAPANDEVSSKYIVQPSPARSKLSLDPLVQAPSTEPTKNDDKD